MIKGRSKEARARVARRALLGRMRRKERYRIALLPERGYLEKGRWRQIAPGGWYIFDYLSAGDALGPFATRKLARIALNRRKRRQDD